MGIFEICVMNDDYRPLISSNYRESELFELARSGGMRPLAEDGLEKVAAGSTTLAELLRVIGPQVVSERACPHCSKRIDARFLFCPFCGTFKQNCCRSCKMPLEESSGRPPVLRREKHGKKRSRGRYVMKKRLLIVDDEPAVAAALRRALQDEDYDNRGCPGGRGG